MTISAINLVESIGGNDNVLRGVIKTHDAYCAVYQYENALKIKKMPLSRVETMVQNHQDGQITDDMIITALGGLVSGKLQKTIAWKANGNP